MKTTIRAITGQLTNRIRHQGWETLGDRMIPELNQGGERLGSFVTQDIRSYRRRGKPAIAPGAVAQLVEQRDVNPPVLGSNPNGPSIFIKGGSHRSDIVLRSIVFSAFGNSAEQDHPRFQGNNRTNWSRRPSAAISENLRSGEETAECRTL